MIDLLSLYFLLPFLLILAVVYGGLEASGIFRNRALKTIISVVLAFFAISNAYLVDMIHTFLPYVVVIFIVFFALGFIGKSLSGRGKDNTMIMVVLGLFLILVASFIQGGGYQQYDNFLWMIGLVVVIGMIYAAYKMQ